MATENSPEHVSPSDSEAQAISDEDTQPQQPRRYLTGWYLWIAGFGLDLVHRLALSVFLPSLEVSIVSTSLITITNEFDGYSQISWVVTSYLTAYTGFLVIWSKLCSIMGLKPSLACSMIIFVAFSAGCGAARSMNQLIVFRAFQGVGGAGVYSITTIGFLQMVPPSKYNTITAVASSLMSLGLMLGPILGGAINQTDQWRWVFYLNIPAGIVGLAVCLLVFPSRFPHHADPPLEKPDQPLSLHLKTLEILKKSDVIGAVLLLGASMLLVTALEEGGVRFAWDSAIIVIFFVVSGVLWAAFTAWEWYASRESSEVVPMFPWRFFTNRIWMGTLFGCFVSGAPLTVAVIELPQRFQLVNANSPLDAGVKLLAYAVATPIGVVTASNLTGRLRIPFVFVLLFGYALQIAGFALLSTLPTTVETWPGQYGYSVLAGLGSGCALGTLYMLAPISVDKADQALAVGSGLQFRMLGGAVGIAVVNSVSSNHIQSHLRSVLQGPELAAVLQSASSVALLPPELQSSVRAVYGEAYNLQLKATIGFCGAGFLAALLIWKKRPLRLGKDGIPV